VAVSVGTAYVSIIPSTKGFAKAVDRQVKSESTGRDMGRKAGRGYTKGFGASLGGLKTLIAGAGFAAAGAAAVAFAKSTVTAASDANEAANAVNVTYGKAAKGVAKLAKQSARAMGLSGTEFSALAVRFSSFTDTVAGPGGDSVKVLDKLTTRAADFASVMNIDVAQAAEVFQSGLSGETEPLKRYGIDLSDAAVQAYALSKGIKQGNEKLTEAQKIQARYGLLMEKTQKTQGDFKNTSTGMANAQRILNAEWADSKAKLGTALLPSLGMVTSKLSALLPVMTTALIPVFTQLGKLATEVITDLLKNLPKVKSTIAEFSKNLGNAIVWGRKNWPEIRESIKSISTALERAGKWVGFLWEQFNKLPPEVKTMIAMLAIAQKTGVLGLVFKGFDFLKSMVVQAGVVNVVGAKGGPVVPGGTPKGGPSKLVAGLGGPVSIAVAAAAAGAILWAARNDPNLDRINKTSARNAAAGDRPGSGKPQTTSDMTRPEQVPQWVLDGRRKAAEKSAAAVRVEIKEVDRLRLRWFMLPREVKLRIATNVTPVAEQVGRLAGRFDVLTVAIRAAVAAVGAAVGAGIGALFTAPRVIEGRKPAFASGGMIPGTGTRDTTPVLTTPGEWVLTRRQVAQVSPARLEAWRQGGPPPGAGSGVQVGQLIINNPKAESASDSLPRSIRKLQHVSAR